MWFVPTLPERSAIMKFVYADDYTGTETGEGDVDDKGGEIQTQEEMAVLSSSVWMAML